MSLIMNVDIAARGGAFDIVFPAVKPPTPYGANDTGRMTPAKDVYVSNMTALIQYANAASPVLLENPIVQLSASYGVYKVTLSSSERDEIAAADSALIIVIYDYDESYESEAMQSVYISVTAGMAVVTENTEFLVKARKNKSVTSKIGSVTYDIVYDDDSTTEILRRALTTPAGANLPDMSAGTYPANAAKSSV